MVDLLAGHVKIATVTFSSAAPLVRSGKLNALALSSEERLPGFPDIPTFKELGYPDMVSLSWFGLSGPKDLPANVIDALNREVYVALQSPVARRRAVEDGILLRGCLRKIQLGTSKQKPRVGPLWQGRSEKTNDITDRTIGRGR
jgi:tripartite-type tricarboxylate transporter receptor subunit TctC